MNASRKALLRVLVALGALAVVLVICRPKPAKNVKKLTADSTVYPLPPSGPCGGDEGANFPNCTVLRAQGGAVQFVSDSLTTPRIIAPQEGLYPVASAPAALLAGGVHGVSIFFQTGQGLTAQQESAFGALVDTEVLIPTPMGTNTGQSNFATPYTMYAETVGPGSFSLPVQTFDACRYDVTTIGRLVSLGAGESGGVGDSFVSYDVVQAHSGPGFGPLVGVTLDRIAANVLQGGAGGIAIDPSYVYYDDTYSFSTGGIYKTLQVGGGTIITLALAGHVPQALVSDGTNVYWDNVNPTGGPIAPVGQVLQISTSGGAITTLATGQDSPSAIATNGSTVAWLTTGNTMSVPGTVSTVPVGGGPVSVIVSGRSAMSGNIGTALVMDSSNVYWIDGGGIVQAPIGGGGVTTLSTDSSVAGLAIDSSYVYWTDSNNGGHPVNKTPIGGGSTISISTQSAFLSYVQAVDASYVYWSDFNGTLWKAPIGGGPPISFASAPNPYFSAPAFAISSTEAFITYSYFSPDNAFVERVSLVNGTQNTGAGGANLGVLADTSMSLNSFGVSYSDNFTDTNALLTVTAANPVGQTQGTIDWTLKVAPQCN